MRFTGKDVLATAVVAVVVVAYVVFVAVGRVWFVDTVREMALVALIFRRPEPFPRWADGLSPGRSSGKAGVTAKERMS